MFRAVLKGKSGSLQKDISADGTSGSYGKIELPSIREDVLTAAVFSRLSYLPDVEFWKILSDTFPILPDRELAQLVNIEFWPRWKYEEKDRKFVEPDIFLQFEIGDPAHKVDLLIEIKRHTFWTQQSSEQHIDQISAYFLNEDEFEKGHEFFFLALGGLGSNSQLRMNSLSSNIQHRLTSDSKIQMAIQNICGSTWLTLIETLETFQTNSNGKHIYLISDLIEILTYAGFKKRIYFGEVELIPPANLSVGQLFSMYSKKGEVACNGKAI